ncbi:MAG: 4Fe-4S binding protein [Dehalococcoidia bacterium]|nr:4Fe-4S binding protein [Dehalococcoidia bacterium]
MAIEKIDQELCNGCRLCIDSCPNDVIYFDEKAEVAYIRYPTDCGVCYLCVDDCARGAISVSAEMSRLPVLPY